jgi:hypothetical protein
MVLLQVHVDENSEEERCLEAGRVQAGVGRCLLGGMGIASEVQRYAGLGRKARIKRMVMKMAPITVLGMKWSEP